MKMRKLGKNGPEISVISMGTRTMEKEKEGIKAVETLLEMGINFIDTAPNYGRNKAEKILGEIISEYRGDIILATKTGYRFTEEGVMPDCSYENISTLLEQSLERLNTKYVDVLQVHGPDPKIDIKKIVQNLEKLVEEGKVRYLGFSNHSLLSLEKIDSDNVICIQDCLNILYSKAINGKLPLCKEKGWGFIAYMPLFMGILANAYTHEKFLLLEKTFPQCNEEIVKNLEKFAEDLNNLARDFDVTSGQLALGWVINQENVTTAIQGSLDPTHIKENAQAIEIENDAVEAVENLRKESAIKTFSIIETQIIKIKEIDGVVMALLDLGAWIEAPKNIKTGDKIKIDALDGSIIRE
ncbi:hypothetical protein DRN45_03905 [Thermococci archaeon]|nr:MAG: hypothetical protein DRN45_03905 [Thermococci archaeon]